MKKEEMINIINEKETLINLLNNNDFLDDNDKNIYINSIVQLDTLIKKLKQLNYNLLLIKSTPFDKDKYNYYSPTELKTDINLIEAIKEVIYIIDKKTCYDVNNIPNLKKSNIYTKNLIENSKIIFKNIYPFEESKIDKIFNTNNILLYKRSLLYKLSQNKICIGQTFYNFVNKNPYIIVEKTYTIQDLYTLIHEAMHAYHLSTTNIINDYVFSEVIAHSTDFFITEYLKNKNINYDQALLKEDLTQDLIIYKIKNYAKYLGDNEKENNIIYNLILETLLPFTIYLNENDSKDLTKKLININGTNHLLNYDYESLNLNYTDIIESSKLLKK